MEALIGRFGAAALKRAILLGIAGALVTSFMVVNTLSSASLGSGSIKIATQAFSDDTDVTVTASGIQVVGASAAAAGTSATGVEATSSNPAVNNALTKDNYAYKFTVTESGVNTLTANEHLKIEVWGDNSTTTTLITTLYMAQATADAVNAEGVTATVDLGSASTIYDNIDVIVTRQ
ncbi:MAG: hypothetical protein HYX93_02855 [Chloroflexi bacterium]|nr:hypothetical protein [Chloroflexota bacterium]